MHSSLQHSDTCGDVEGVASEVEQHHNCKDEGNRAAVNIILPNQPSNSQFPRTAFGKQNCSFQSAWFRDYPWLHYDEKNNSTFCYISINQSEKGNLNSAPKLDQLIIALDINRVFFKLEGSFAWVPRASNIRMSQSFD